MIRYDMIRGCGYPQHYFHGW